MFLSFTHNGRQYENMTWDPAVARIGDVAVVASAARSTAIARLTDRAEAARDTVRSTAPGRLVTKLILAQVGASIATQPAAVQTQFDAIATARGLDRAGLVTEVAANAHLYHEATLTIEVAYEQGVALIEAAADTEAAISAAEVSAAALLPPAITSAQTILTGVS